MGHKIMRNIVSKTLSPMDGGLWWTKYPLLASKEKKKDVHVLTFENYRYVVTWKRRNCR